MSNQGKGLDRNSLSNEIKSWVDLNIISPAQAKKIGALYSSKKGRENESAGFNIVPYISVFGALMIGAGIILFFALNWASIPKAVKVASLLGFLVAFYHLGYTLRFTKGNFPKVGGALIFLGAVLFGANIALIGQIFNISSHWPNMFLFWALASLLMAYLVGYLPTLFLGLITFLVYVGTESFFWFEKIPYHYNTSRAFFLIFMSMGVLYYTIGSLHQKIEKIHDLRYPYHLIGAFLVLGTCYLLSFKWFSEDYYGRYNGSEGISLVFSSQFWVIYLLVSAIALTALALRFMKKDGSTLEFYEIFLLGILLVFSPIVVLLAKVNFWFVPVLFNIILFSLIVASVYVGSAKREKTLVNLGVFAFGISITSRYFEYLWDVLNGYLFFIIGGALLIGLSIFLERNRRKIIQHFDD